MRGGGIFKKSGCFKTAPEKLSAFTRTIQELKIPNLPRIRDVKGTDHFRLMEWCPKLSE
jgi:hypothetical protein